MLPRLHGRPELAGLPAASLQAHQRGQLKGRYRKWTRSLEQVAGEPLHCRSPDGGQEINLGVHSHVASCWNSWRQLVDELSSPTSARLPAQSATGSPP
jgi:hypothetical protein